MSESVDYQAFKRHVVHPLDRIDRIENIVIPGMPDVNYCANAIECWLEFKSPKEPKRITSKLFASNHKLSVEQRNWFLRQRNAGGHAFIMIVTDKRWLLIHGEHADRINSMTVLELIEISLWVASKPIRSPELWRTLRKVILENSCAPQRRISGKNKERQ